MNRKQLVNLIADAQEAYRAEHGVDATHMKLTREIRNSIGAWSRDEVGGDALASLIFREGVEKALPTLLGLTVLQWDAEKFALEVISPVGKKYPDPNDGWKPSKF